MKTETPATHARFAWLDGLRAVAVVLVVLYHFDLCGATGGFIGVDVFFVISGYCICRSMLRAQASDSGFRLRDFWRNRVLRIIPASVVMMLAILLAAFLLMSPPDFVRAATAILWQSVFAQNFHEIIAEVGYDAPLSNTKPLLHMWSLAVEEQFYIIFPILMVTLWATKSGYRRQMIVLSGVAAVSLLWNIYASFFVEISAYYEPFGRAWEMLAGVLVACVQTRLGTFDMPRAKRQLLAGLGLVMIVGPGFVYTHETVFPGIAAATPVLGAVLLIIANAAGDTHVGRVLARAPMAFTGRISYSFYLWHWPVYVFATYFALAPLSLGERLGLVAVAYLLAILSWRFVESPFQTAKAKAAPIRSIYGRGMAMIVAAAVAAALVVWADGWPARLPRSMTPAEIETWGQNDLPDDSEPEEIRSFVAADKMPRLGTVSDQPPLFLLIGDSHARSVRDVLGPVAADAGIWGYSGVGGGLLPLEGCTYDFGSTKMAETNAILYDFVVANHIPNVILAGRWDWGYNGVSEQVLFDDEHPEETTASSREVFAIHARETVRQYRAAGVRVWVLSQVPLQPFNVPQKLSLMRNGVGGISLAQHSQMQDPVDSIFRTAGAEIIDPRTGLFDENGRSIIVHQGVITYFDDDHLSPYGMRLMTAEFARVLRAMQADTQPPPPPAD